MALPFSLQSTNPAPFPMNTAAVAAVDGGRRSAASATTIGDLHPDVLTRILCQLDGPALANASCATSHFHALANDRGLWENLCLSAWPSLRHPLLLPLIPSFRSFFSDAYPFPDPESPAVAAANGIPRELISAVDLYHKGDLIFSRLLGTGSNTSWFLGSPFRVDALDRKDPSPPQQKDEEGGGEEKIAIISPEDLTLSWIIIDPAAKRAVNMSSRKPVSIDRHWYTGEIQARFCTVLNEGTAAASAVVTCGKEAMQVMEVSLTVDGMDGGCLDGKESLAVLQGAMEGRRRGNGREGAAVKERYWEYERRKSERKEKKMRREGKLDLCCMAVAASLFLPMIVMALR